MAESKKVESQDIISDDLFVENIKQAKLFEAEINKLVIGLKEVNKETTKTLKANKDPKTAEQIKVVTKALEDKKKVDESIVKLEERKAILAKKVQLLTVEEVKQQTVAKQLAKDRKAELEALAIIESHLIGTEQKLLATQTLLRLERKKLNEADKDYAVNLARINKAIDENNAKISANSDKLKQNKMNVGNYTDSMREAINTSNLFSGATNGMTEANKTMVDGLGSAVSGIKATAEAMKGAEGMSKKFGAGMKALGIGAIIAGVKGLVSWFQSTGAGAENLKQIFSGFSAIISTLTGRMVDFAKGLGTIAEGIYSLDWDKIKDGAKQAGNAFDNMTDQMKNQIKAEVELTKAIQEHEKALRVLRIEQQKLNLDEEDYNEIAGDTTRGIQEQREALEKAIVSRKKSATISADIATRELTFTKNQLINDLKAKKQTKEVQDALKDAYNLSAEEILKSKKIIAEVNPELLDSLEERVKAEIDANDKLADLPRQEAMRRRASIQAQTAFEIDLIQKKKLNAGSEVAILTKKIADEKIQLLDREIFISELAKAEKKSTDEQARLFNEGLKKENEVNKNNEARLKKLVDFNDLIATKDEVILGHKLKALQLTEAQTEQTAKIVKEAQTNQIANDELILKLQNDKIASLERQFKLQNDLVSLQKQSEIDILKEQETEKQKMLDDANTKILEGENVNNQIMIDYRKQTYEATVKYLDLEYEARLLQLKRNAILAKIENDKIVEDDERILANKKIDEQYKIDSDKLERERSKTQLENSEKNDKATSEITKRKIELEKEKTKEVISELQKVTSAISQEFENQNNLQNDAKSKEIEKTKSNIERQRELAEKGSSNTLAFEESQLAKRELQQKEALERQAKEKEIILLTEAYLNALNARLSEVGGDPNQAPIKALGDILIAKGIAKGVAGSFIDGTDGEKTLGEMLGKTNTQDGHLILADDNERIFSPKQTSKIKGFTNDEVADTIFNLRTGKLPSLTATNQKQDTASNIYASMMLQSNAMIEKKLDALIAKPVQHIEADTFGNIRESIIRDSQKTVINHKSKRIK